MPVDSMTQFGALLRQHRLAAHLTQEGLAERAGISVHGVQKLERGTTHPYRDTAERLLSALALEPRQAEQFRASVEIVRRHGSPQRDDARPGVRHNLPVALTSFIGRERELVDLPDRLQRARLLTLTGVGGAGKTRLAIEVARHVVGQYQDGVWLVEFAQITDPALVPHRLGAVIGVRETPDRPILQALADALRNSRILLVLDNCEHVLEACAPLADMLLRECSTLKMLATSREPIGIQGEITWPIAPLGAPETGATFLAFERSPAVRLFSDRASAVQPRFALNDENVSVIAHICRRLDGIPLALELAAACLDALSTQQLASRVDRDLHLLAMGNRAALPRQQTLTAAIDWSYQLLTDEQRRVFERLSVFASGWTLEAAEAACAGDGVASEHVLDVVVQLIRKSLVVRVDDERYGLLETLRVYALEKLRERGQDFAATRERHAMYYSALMERLDPVAPTRLLTKRSDVAQVSVRQVVEEAHDNVRLALRWCLDTQRATEGLDFIRALGPLWIARGVPPDGRRWVEAMLELAERTPDPISRASQAQALMFGGISARVQRDLATAQKFLEHCVAIYRTLDDDLGLVYGLANLGINQFAIGDFVRADDTLSEGLALARSAGDANTISVVLTPLGTLATLRGQHDRATEFLYESATLGRTVHRPDMRRHLVGRALGFLGWALSEQRKFDAAMLVFEDALAGPEAPVAREMLSRILDWTAAIFGATGQPLRAARLFGAAETQWLASGAKRYPVDDMTYERDLRDVQAQLQNDEFAEAWAEGRAMTAEQAIAHALRET